MSFGFYLERWLPVRGYEGLYEVSSYGRVRSLDRVVIRSDGRRHSRKGKTLRVVMAGRDREYPFASLSKDGKCRSFGIHVLVYQAFFGPIAKGMEVDHRDRNKTNCNIENLRLASRSQNHGNTGIPRSNRSGFKGVSWSGDKQRWCAQIKINGRHIFLGYFADAELAAKVYDKKSKELFGEFAHTNEDMENC